MSHSNGSYDTDLHFVIDPVTRTVRNESGKVTIIQYDHNSERITFEIPRYIDGHDMSECNRVEVHYNNIATSQTNRGLYEVTDLQVSPDDSRYVTCSWLISQNATRLVGRLAFGKTVALKKQVLHYPKLDGCDFSEYRPHYA